MSRQFQITIDAADPLALSTFWRDALGYVHPARPGVELPEGKVADNRLHLDVRAARRRPGCTATPG